MGLTKALVKHETTVNGLASNPTSSPMMQKDNQTNITLERILLKRYIMPEEIANMTVILNTDYPLRVIQSI